MNGPTLSPIRMPIESLWGLPLVGSSFVPYRKTDLSANTAAPMVIPIGLQSASLVIHFVVEKLDRGVMVLQLQS